jgi:hypothetical protein
MLARRYLVPPRCGASAEATLRQQAGVDVSLPCTGAGMEAAETVAVPGHGTVGPLNPVGPAVRYTPSPGVGGNDSFTVRVVNDGGASGVVSVTVSDRLKPVIRKLRFVRPKSLRGAGTSAKRGGKRKRRPQFTVAVTEPAKVVVTVERAVRGVRRGKRCVRAPRGATGKRCTRYVKLGRIGSRAARRSLRLPIPRKLARKIAKGGPDRATAVATDTVGNRSRPKSIRVP